MKPSDLRRRERIAERLKHHKCACGAQLASTRRHDCDACRERKRQENILRLRETRAARKAGASQPTCPQCGTLIGWTAQRCRRCYWQSRDVDRKRRDERMQIEWMIDLCGDVATVAEDAALLDAQFPWLAGCERCEA